MPLWEGLGVMFVFSRTHCSSMNSKVNTARSGKVMIVQV